MQVLQLGHERGVVGGILLVGGRSDIDVCGEDGEFLGVVGVGVGCNWTFVEETGEREGRVSAEELAEERVGAEAEGHRGALITGVLKIELRRSCLRTILRANGLRFT